MTGMTVREATLATAITVPHDTPIKDAERLLIESGSSEVYVTDAEGLLIGIVPDYEFIKRHLLSGSTTLLVRHLMSPVSLSLVPSAPLEQAALYLRENIHSRLPVVVNHRVIGQVTRATLLKALAKQTENLLSSTELPEWFSPLADNVIPKPKFLTPKTSRETVTTRETVE